MSVLNNKVSLPLWQLGFVILVIGFLVVATLWILNVESRFKTVSMNDQAIVNLLVYNMQKGKIEQIPQQQAPPATPAETPKKAEQPTPPKK